MRFVIWFCLLFPSSAIATVTEYEGIFVGYPDWIEAVNGDFTTVSFIGYKDGAMITTQYSHLGVVLMDGDDTAYPSGSMIIDGIGLDGNFSVTLEFAAPMTWLATRFPGNHRYKLYMDSKLLYTSTILGMGGLNNFGGVISTEPFNRVVISPPFSPSVAIDDLYFGPPIPVVIGDMNADGVVGPFDLAQLLAQWGQCDNPFNCPADIAPPGGDDIVGPADLAQLLAHWGGDK